MISSAIRSHILVVEDNTDIRQLLYQALIKADFQVSLAANLSQANAYFREDKTHPELIILDLGLPDGDGSQWISQLRLWSTLPIIVLSARFAEHDKIHALDAGADDYLTKPFSTDELLARVRAQCRRLVQLRQQNAQQAMIQFADFHFDRHQQQLWQGTNLIHLTHIEAQLLAVLTAHAGQVLTHRQLLVAVWGGEFSEESHYLRIYIRHLRKKIESDPARPKYLLTEVGVGYRFLLSG
ncbi:response regulator [Agitococcus lubricus]|uniref:Two-component system KDP operon response regulator KdpE n=1 Tax=Agitococcus lubricus TaxID=1077255 RepID=A0A2T5J1L7_9GAMM|nr:response regulator [Agitococcus lubricus]PTQ90189.1 two-component system KDP operon response regulator KdpE [Agitococcus lubricus]